MVTLKDPSLLKTQCLLQEGWCDSEEKIEVYNPFSGERIAAVPSIKDEILEKAIAYSASAQKAWSNDYTADQRAAIVHAWADLVDANIEDLACIMTAEQGKPLKEAMVEIRYANSFLRWFAEEGKRIYGDVIPAKATHLRYTVFKQAVGVCAAITPWNFPTAMIARKVAPALAAGCSIIVMPDSNTPLSALAFAGLGIKAGLPTGVLQVVTGDAPRLGKVLCASSIVRKLSFTGSTRVGRILMEQCAPTLKKLSLELGGNAPFIVFEDANLEMAVGGLMASKYRNAGQTCVCANRIFVHESIQERFVQLLSEKIKGLVVGDGMDSQTTVGPLIHRQSLEKVERLQQDALSKGALCIEGGARHRASALSYAPTILVNVTADMAIAREEIFGPMIAIQRFSTEKEVIGRANDSEMGLAAYFYTNDHSRAWRVTERLEYGMVGHNTGLFSNEVAPFGGIKQSGFGREGSKYGIEEYLTIKYWCTSV